MRIIFLGTPEIALPSLKKLYESKHEVIAVVAQPDKPSNRNKIVFSPVKKFALEHDIPLYQFEKISREVSILTELAPDVMITVAYGQMLSQKVLNVAKYGVINAHASLLPKYRGASPIQTAIIEGETVTGMTIMRTVLKMDAGEIILQEKLPISATDTTETLMEKLGELAPDMLLAALEQMEKGTASYLPQKEEEATFCVKLTKEQALVDFTLPTEKIIDFIRGYNPNPVAYTIVNGEQMKVFSSIVSDYPCGNEQAGTVLYAGKKGLIVKTSNGAVELIDIQAANGKRMTAKCYLCGHNIAVGTVLPQGKNDIS